MDWTFAAFSDTLPSYRQPDLDKSVLTLGSNWTQAMRSGIRL